MLDLSLVPPVLGVIGLIVAMLIYGVVKTYDEGEDKVKQIGDQIHLGAMVFMRREYTMLAAFAAVWLTRSRAHARGGPVLLLAAITVSLSVPVAEAQSQTDWYVGASIGKADADYSAGELQSDLAARGWTITWC